MKMLIAILMFVSVNAFALDMGDLQSQGAKLAEQAKAKAQDVMAACKDDKVKYCEKYNEMGALKECLKQNKDNLSAGCKKSVGL